MLLIYERFNELEKMHPIVEAGYKLTIAEQRIILLSLAKLDNRNIENSNVTLYVKDYGSAFNLSETSAYSGLRIERQTLV